MKINVTPEMIDAGLDVFCDYLPDTGDSISEFVERMFNAMMAKAQAVDSNYVAGMCPKPFGDGVVYISTDGGKKWNTAT